MGGELIKNKSRNKFELRDLYSLIGEFFGY